MTRHRTPPAPADPVDVTKFTRDDKVWIYVGGGVSTAKHKMERAPGVVKRVDQSSIAVLAIAKGLVVTFHITEARRIDPRVREQFQTKEPDDFPIDKHWEIARFA